MEIYVSYQPGIRRSIGRYQALLFCFELSFGKAAESSLDAK